MEREETPSSDRTLLLLCDDALASSPGLGCSDETEVLWTTQDAYVELGCVWEDNTPFGAGEGDEMIYQIIECPDEGEGGWLFTCEVEVE